MVFNPTYCNWFDLDEVQEQLQSLLVVFIAHALKNNYCIIKGELYPGNIGRHFVDLHDVLQLHPELLWASYELLSHSIAYISE